MARQASKSAVGIVNAITEATNTVARAQLPFVTKETFSDFGKQLTVAPDEVRNAWIDNFYNLCGLQIIMGKRMYESYFKKLYREPTYTENIALFMVDAIKAKAYDKNATSRILENEPPRVGTQYIQSVLRRMYQCTDIEELLVAAFTSGEGGFMSLLEAETTQMYSSMEDDNVEMIKEMLTKNIEEGNIRIVPITKPDTKDELLAFMRKVKTIGGDWDAERSREWNLAGFRTYSPADDHYFLLNTDMNSLNEVYNLPWAFNQDYLSLKSEGKAIVMGSSGLADGNAYAMMFDRDFFQIRDKVGFPKYRSFVNDGTLAINRMIHIWTILGLSYFSNAAVFIDPSKVAEPTAATLATRDGSLAANPGEEKELYVSAITAASGKYADKFGEWHILAASKTSAKTTIDKDSGVLTIGDDEEGVDGTIVVTWKSHLSTDPINPTASVEITINH